MTVGTILGHFEKLKHVHPKLEIEMYKPTADKLKKLKPAYNQLRAIPENVYGDGKLKLAVFHKHFNNQYSYNELKIGLVVFGLKA